VDRGFNIKYGILERPVWLPHFTEINIIVTIVNG
jgi:hypothetical protein